jgi:hypothetical protein
MFRCWLSTEKGLIWAFVAPVLGVVLVCTLSQLRLNRYSCDFVITYMYSTDHHICTYLTCVFFIFQINLIILLLVIRIMLVAVNAIPPSGQKSQNASIRYTQTTTRLALDESSLVITMRVAKTLINYYQNLNSK